MRELHLTVSVLSKRRQERIRVLESEVERLTHIIGALNGQVIQESEEIQRLKKELDYMTNLVIEEPQ